MYQFRDSDFGNYRQESDKIYSTIGKKLKESGQAHKPYAILLSNHGIGQQDDKNIQN